MKTDIGSGAIVFCDRRIICCGFIKNGKYVGSVDGSPYYMMQEIPGFEEMELKIIDAEIQHDLPTWMVRDALDHVADMKEGYEEYMAWEQMVASEKYAAKVQGVIAAVSVGIVAVGMVLLGGMLL